MERLAHDPPGDAAGSDRQAEVVARLAGDLRRPAEAQLALGGSESDLEGRPLVLLDPDLDGVAGGLETPAAEQPPGGDRELERRAAEAVGGRARARRGLAVGIDQPELDRTIDAGAQPAVARGARVEQHLGEKLLARPVERAVGEDQRALPLRLPPVAPRHPPLDPDRLVPLGAHDDRHAAPAHRLGEPGKPREAVGVGRDPRDELRELLPGEAVERRLGAGERRAARARERAHGERVVAGAEGRVAQHDERRELELDCLEEIAAGAEVRARRGDDEEAPALAEWRRDEGAVVAQVLRRRELDAPGRVGRAPEERADPALVPALEAHRPAREVGALEPEGAEVEPLEVAVGHQERAPAGGVDAHRRERVARSLELGAQRAAGGGARRAGEGAIAGAGESARAQERLGRVARALHPREPRLAHRPPGVGAELLQAARERGADRAPVLGGGESAVEMTEALEAGLERRAELAAAAMPALELAEERRELRQRVEAGLGEALRGRRERRAVDERREVELPELGGVGRAPVGAVGEALGPEVGDGVLERRPDPRGVVVGGDLRQVAGTPRGERFSERPDAREGAIDLVGELVARREREVELARGRDHALALADLPGVGVEIGAQRLGVVEGYRGARERCRGPRARAQLGDRALVAAERDGDLRAPHERAPELAVVAARARRLLDRRDPLAGGGQLLLAEQPLDLGPRGGRGERGRGGRGLRSRGARATCGER
jgi:hypothetical protein